MRWSNAELIELCSLFRNVLWIHEPTQALSSIVAGRREGAAGATLPSAAINRVPGRNISHIHLLALVRRLVQVFRQSPTPPGEKRPSFDTSHQRAGWEGDGSIVLGTSDST